MTLTRLVVWMLVWGTGWGLFFVQPEAHSGLGAALLLGVAPLVMVKPRQWRKDARSRGAAIALTALVVLFLVLVFVFPPSYRWQFPADPRLVVALKAFGILIAAFGIAANWLRFVRDPAACSEPAER